jgi:hypothetical protein
MGAVCTFNPENGYSMFLQNAGIYVCVHMASQPRTTTVKTSDHLNYASILYFIDKTFADRRK